MKFSTITAAKVAYEEEFSDVWESSVEEWATMIDTNPEDYEDLYDVLSNGQADMIEWAIANNK